MPWRENHGAVSIPLRKVSRLFNRGQREESVIGFHPSKEGFKENKGSPCRRGLLAFPSL